MNLKKESLNFAYMNTNYIEELNEGQRAAVLYNEGPRRGFGRGWLGEDGGGHLKYNFLLENGFPPMEFVLSFTNKAAREMKRAYCPASRRPAGVIYGWAHSIPYFCVFCMWKP